LKYGLKHYNFNLTSVDPLIDTKSSFLSTVIEVVVVLVSVVEAFGQQLLYLNK